MGGRKAWGSVASALGNVIMPVIGGAAAGAAVNGSEGAKRGAIGGISNILMMPGLGDAAMALTAKEKKSSSSGGAVETLEDKKLKELAGASGGDSQFGNGALSDAVNSKRKRSTLVSMGNSGALSSANTLGE